MNLKTPTKPRSATNILARKRLKNGSFLKGNHTGKKYLSKTCDYRQVLADQPTGSFTKSHDWRGAVHKGKRPKLILK